MKILIHFFFFSSLLCRAQDTISVKQCDRYHWDVDYLQEFTMFEVRFHNNNEKIYTILDDTLCVFFDRYKNCNNEDSLVVFYSGCKCFSISKFEPKTDGLLEYTFYDKRYIVTKYANYNDKDVYNSIEYELKSSLSENDKFSILKDDLHIRNRGLKKKQIYKITKDSIFLEQFLNADTIITKEYNKEKKFSIVTLRKKNKELARWYVSSVDINQNVVIENRCRGSYFKYRDYIAIFFNQVIFKSEEFLKRNE